MSLNLASFGATQLKSTATRSLKGGITEEEFWEVYNHLIGTGNSNDAQQAAIIVNMYAAGNIQFE